MVELMEKWEQEVRNALENDCLIEKNGDGYIQKIDLSNQRNCISELNLMEILTNDDPRKVFEEMVGAWEKRQTALEKEGLECFFDDALDQKLLTEKEAAAWIEKNVQVKYDLDDFRVNVSINSLIDILKTKSFKTQYEVVHIFKSDRHTFFEYDWRKNDAIEGKPIVGTDIEAVLDMTGKDFDHYRLVGGPFGSGPDDCRHLIYDAPEYLFMRESDDECETPHYIGVKAFPYVDKENTIDGQSFNQTGVWTNQHKEMDSRDETVKLTMAEEQQIYQKIHNAILLENAKAQYFQNVGEKEIEISEPTEEDYQRMVDYYERRHDCNATENDMWEYIISQYVEKVMNKEEPYTYIYRSNKKIVQIMDDEGVIGIIDSVNILQLHKIIKSHLYNDMTDYIDRLQNEEQLDDSEQYMVLYKKYIAKDLYEEDYLKQCVEFNVSKKQIIENVKNQKYVEGAAYYNMKDFVEYEPQVFSFLRKYSFDPAEYERLKPVLEQMIKEHCGGSWDVNSVSFNLLNLVKSCKEEIALIKVITEAYLVSNSEDLEELWCVIAEEAKLDEAYMRKFIDYLPDDFAYYQNLSLEFIDEMRNRLNWAYVIEGQRSGLTRDYLRENRDFIKSLPNYDDIERILIDDYNLIRSQFTREELKRPTCITFEDVLDIFYDDCEKFICLKSLAYEDPVGKWIAGPQTEWLCISHRDSMYQLICCDMENKMSYDDVQWLNIDQGILDEYFMKAGTAESLGFIFKKAISKGKKVYQLTKTPELEMEGFSNKYYYADPHIRKDKKLIQLVINNANTYTLSEGVCFSLEQWEYIKTNLETAKLNYYKEQRRIDQLKSEWIDDETIVL